MAAFARVLSIGRWATFQRKASPPTRQGKPRPMVSKYFTDAKVDHAWRPLWLIAFVRVYKLHGLVNNVSPPAPAMKRREVVFCYLIEPT
jgi:hypothetical protein